MRFLRSIERARVLIESQLEIWNELACGYRHEMINRNCYKKFKYAWTVLYDGDVVL